jgi:hypothetical protein
MTRATEACCPSFRPETWNEKEVSWQGKLFAKDRVRSFLHIPLNYGSVLRKNLRQIEAVNAAPEERLVLSQENSLWGADIYVAVTKEVAGLAITSLSGRFLAKVFEGPYKNIPDWIRNMKEYVASKGIEMKQLYFYYTTCPKCAKKYGKNYVVLLARV